MPIPQIVEDTVKVTEHIVAVPATDHGENRGCDETNDNRNKSNRHHEKQHHQRTEQPWMKTTMLMTRTTATMEAKMPVTAARWTVMPAR